MLYQDPSGEIVPAVLGAAAVIGAVTNSAIYAVTSSSTGEFSWGGLAGAAVSGLITGAGIATGASLAGEYSANGQTVCDCKVPNILILVNCTLYALIVELLFVDHRSRCRRCGNDNRWCCGWRAGVHHYPAD